MLLRAVYGGQGNAAVDRCLVHAASQSRLADDAGAAPGGPLRRLLECERACPEHIPLGLLARYVADSVERRFDYKAVDDPSVVAPMGVYRPDDDEEFIR